MDRTDLDPLDLGLDPQDPWIFGTIHSPMGLTRSAADLAVALSSLGDKKPYKVLEEV